MKYQYIAISSVFEWADLCVALAPVDAIYAHKEPRGSITLTRKGRWHTFERLYYLTEFSNEWRFSAIFEVSDSIQEGAMSVAQTLGERELPFLYRTVQG